MVENAILSERVTHELSGDITHDPTKIQNPPKLDDFTQFRNLSKKDDHYMGRKNKKQKYKMFVCTLNKFGSHGVHNAMYNHRLKPVRIPLSTVK